MSIFSDIVTHNIKRPMVERVQSRKHAGPYHWTPRDAATSDGFGFYCSQRSELAMDGHGSICNLRLELANDHLRGSRLAQTSGYYCDDYGDQTLIPIIARLPHGRGFLAGWTMGAGMCGSMCTAIHDDEREAAMAAHDEAERCAERERDAQAAFDADADEA